MELKVKLHTPENDSYVELWQVIKDKGEDGPRYIGRYIGRYTGGHGEWSYVSDPLGYCELDHSLSPDIDVIVCDKNGNELFHSNNGDGSACFPTSKQAAQVAWREYCSKHDLAAVTEDTSANFYAHYFSGTPAGALNTWLLSFKDPDIFGKSAYDYPENWCMAYEEVEDTVLSHYEYLGENIAIKRYKCKHRVCGVEWFEYYAGSHYMAAEFNQNNIGTMYSQRQAKELLTKAILVNHPDRRVLSYMLEYGAGSEKMKIGEKVRIGDAWETLCTDETRGRLNLHRKYVDTAAAEETVHSRFFDNIDKLREIYPDCIASTNHTLF